MTRKPAPISDMHNGIEEMLRLVLGRLDDMKAEDIIHIDLRGKSAIADYLVVASGTSNRHVGAIAGRVVEELRKVGTAKPRIEGIPNCDWVLIDAGDIIVHIFRPEVRTFYSLEKMWSGSTESRRAS